MQRAWFGVILCIVALFGLPQGSVSAQDVPTPVGWEMGLVYSDGASEDAPFQLEEGELRFASGFVTITWLVILMLHLTMTHLQVRL